MLSKFIVSILALTWIWKNPESSPFVQAFVIGIAPIWAEVIASYVTKIEPARIQDKKLLNLDAVIDIFVFVIAPAFWFWKFSDNTSMEALALVIFLVCGVYRIIRFVRKGLENGKFSGLPVTYTGYLWIILVGLYAIDLSFLSSLVIIIVATLMITKHIQIKPSR